MPFLSTQAGAATEQLPCRVGVPGVPGGVRQAVQDGRHAGPLIIEDLDQALGLRVHAGNVPGAAPAQLRLSGQWVTTTEPALSALGGLLYRHRRLALASG